MDSKVDTSKMPSTKINENLVFLDGDSLSTKEVERIAMDPTIQLAITSKTAQQIEVSRQMLDKFIEENKVIYGVNTGVGGFVNWLIPIDSAQSLQENLIAAVATNVGSYLDNDVVRASILVRLNSLARGCSAISLENFNKLLSVFNSGIIPCIPSKGSLGASGDLGPLAFIALVCIGQWKAEYQGQILPGDEALKRAGIEPMKLGYKEGLSLINGTSVMTSLAALLVERSVSLLNIYELISCLTFEALHAKRDPFNPIVHEQKPHQGQLSSAKNIWYMLNDSKMIGKESFTEKQLQSCDAKIPTFTNYPIEDAYSIRCTPHILGPIKESLAWIKSVVTNEINSSNDNPLIIPGYEEVFHNGHFHGQYIAMAMDHLSIALTTLSNLSDRRIDRLMDVNHSNGLPPFLCKESPGLRLGLMGGQFMATSITAENRSLCHPVSTQSLTSTGDFQDIVSFGLIAARRAQEIYTNTVYILAFELMCGAQGAEIRGMDLLSSATSVLFKNVRKKVPYLSNDQCLTKYLEDLSKSIKTKEIIKGLDGINSNFLLSENKPEEQMIDPILMNNGNPIDLNAAYYVRHSSLQNNLAKMILSSYPLNQHAHILDVGCGDGRITVELANQVSHGKVTGLDSSPSMIKFASENFTKQQFPNLDFQLGMAENITFFEKFDLIVSFSCFHWLKNPKRALSKLSVALRHGGEILVLTYPKESPYYRYLQIALQNYPEYYNLSSNDRMLTTDEYKQLFLKNGLKISEFKEQYLSALYNSHEEIKEYIKGWLGSYVCLPEHLHDSFLEDVIRVVRNDPATRNGDKISLPYTALTIKAHK